MVLEYRPDSSLSVLREVGDRIDGLRQVLELSGLSRNVAEPGAHTNHDPADPMQLVAGPKAAATCGVRFPSSSVSHYVTSLSSS